MCEQPIVQIRQSIKLAERQEAQTHDLQNYLCASLPRLHKAIDLPDENPNQALLNFVVQYIEHVPDVLETLTTLLKEADIYEACEVFIHIAEDFFLKPPEIIQTHTGLHALIDEAYLAHRLMEEVNDRLIMLCGVPLTPMDMTLANIIVHDLLGEEYANQLDLAVHYAIEALFNQDELDNGQLRAMLKVKNIKHWKDVLKRWPGIHGNDGDILLNLRPSTADSIH